jgi:hypothetical protein
MYATLLVASLLLLGQTAPATLALEIRVFAGSDEVTGETRVAIHRAGERSAPVVQSQTGTAQHLFNVPAGIYDAQVVRERDGRVLNIRWAERLVVMPYPDEAGRHLEVINFTNGYGALQVRSSGTVTVPQVALYAAGERSRPAATPVGSQSEAYALFVVAAGRYDIQVRSGPRGSWHSDIEVPLDRTRLWITP